jgi:prepilin-type N-terminal cleavage/methylation domain-containing protein
MAIMQRSVARSNGFTMLEVLLSVLIVLVTSTVYLMWQKTTWSQTTLSNRRMRACQVIEKQIEWRRMIISQNPVTNFAAFKSISGKDTVMCDTTGSPVVSVEWKIHPDSLLAPNGDTVMNVVPVQLIASWGSGQFDTLKLWTNVTQNF